MISKDLKEKLIQNDFFADISEQELDRLEESFFITKNFSAGKSLIEKGKLAVDMFLIIKGCVQVHKIADDEAESVEIIRRYAGDMIGEMGLVENKPRSTNVIAETALELIYISRKNFYKLLDRLPKAKNNIMRKIAARLRESDARSTTLINRYHILLELNREVLQQKIELERLNHELEQKNELLYKAATIDHLTGVYNRSYMIEVFRKEFNNSKRYGFPLCCLVIDLDHFKSINDTYGHQGGDFILISLAKLIQQNLREGDVFCRFGGEEFFILLPHANLDIGLKVAEKIRQLVEIETFLFEGMEIRLTLSVGITDIDNESPRNEDEMLRFADKALYSAKQQGRNCIVIYDSSFLEA